MPPLADIVAQLTEPFQFPFMQRAVIEMLLLAIPGGLLGSWIVLRRLAFFTHAVGTATFPGLAFAGAVGLSPQIAALTASLAFAFGVERTSNKKSSSYDTGTALALVAMLALGVVLASDVYRSGTAIDRLLFGSLVGVGNDDLIWSLGTALGALAITGICFRSWLTTSFDPSVAPALGVKSKRLDWVLLVAIAVAVVASLDAVGSLLVSAIFVLPAATVALYSRKVTRLMAGSVLLAVFEGFSALLIAYHFDAPPGPVVAVTAGSIFGLAVVCSAISKRSRSHV